MTWYMDMLWVLMWVSGIALIIGCSVMSLHRVMLWRAWRRAHRAPVNQQLGEDFLLWEAEYRSRR